MPKKSKSRGKKKSFRSKKLFIVGSPYEEIYNIVAAIIITALVFAYNWQYPEQTFGTLPKTLAAVLICFAFYLAVQKLLASKFGCVATYKIWLPGVVFSVLLMVVGIKIVLVGAVSLAAYKFSRWGMKSRNTSMTENGWIGVSGPITASLVGIFFKIAGFPYFANICLLIALFNLIPIKPLDGSKVFLWDPIIWAFFVFIVFLIITPSGLLSYLTSIYGSAT